MTTIVVIGAGVIGLSTAIKLQQEGFKVVIISKLNPTCAKSIEYTSQWAGAHHVSVATEEKQHKLDSDTFKEMTKLMASDSDMPMMFLPQTELRETPYPEGGDVQFDLLSKYSPDFRKLEQSELPLGVTYGVTFSTIYIDTPNYLLYLWNQFQSSGGIYHQASLSSLASIFNLPSLPSLLDTTSVIVNCTGIGALGFSNDQDVYPTRGQTVLVRSPWVKAGITRTGLPGEGIYTYIIPRKSGDVIIGGTADVGDWEPNCRNQTSEMIMRRGIALCPELLPESKREGGKIEDLDVIEFGCGFRPTRKGGIRLETDEVDFEGRKIPVVHNYGHGGYGYQSSWGSAIVAVNLVKSVV